MNIPVQKALGLFRSVVPESFRDKFKTNTQSSRDLTPQWVNKKLINLQEKQHLFPVRYAYDYVGDQAAHISSPQLKVNCTLQKRFSLQMSTEEDAKPIHIMNDNGIDLFPVSAGLPWATGFRFVRQSKHWKTARETARGLLELFVVHESRTEIGRLARQELQGFEESWVKFALYMFPEADAQKMSLITASMVYIFVFDDFWEAHDEEEFTRIREEYISRMVPGYIRDMTSRTEVQAMIDWMIDGFHEQDRISGDKNGLEVIQSTLKFFNRRRPLAQYTNMEDFLQYRREDAAIDHLLACAKFSVGSSADTKSPKLGRIVQLLKSHVSVANDLASWDKEKRAYETGKVLYLINTVDITQRLLSLPNDRAAIAITYAFQLEIERDIDSEIEELGANKFLSPEEWRFVGAALYVASANVLVNTIMSRYGGEAAKLGENREKTK